MSNGLQKIIKLRSCLACPFLHHPDYSVVEEKKKPIKCGVLERKIKIEKCKNDFPKWCPLETYGVKNG